MNQQQGFSLIELSVVLSVMSILAVLAAGSYTSHNTKAQTAEAFPVVKTLQAEFVSTYTDNQAVPPNTLPEILGTGATANDVIGNFISSVDLDGGVLVVTYGIGAGPDLTGKILTFTPHESGSRQIIWQCGLAPTPVDGLAAPLLVAGSSAGSPITGSLAVTTVGIEYLPRNCRL